MSKYKKGDQLYHLKLKHTQQTNWYLEVKGLVVESARTSGRNYYIGVDNRNWAYEEDLYTEAELTKAISRLTGEAAVLNSR